MSIRALMSCALVLIAVSAAAEGPSNDPVGACFAGELANVRSCVMGEDAALCHPPTSASGTEGFQAFRACRKAVEDRTKAFLEGEKACAERGAFSGCLAFEATRDGSLCIKHCLEDRIAKVVTDEKGQLVACIETYVTSGGKKRGSCAIEGAVRDIPATPSIDDVAAAVRAKDAPALDAIGRRFDAFVASKEQDACAKECVDRAPKVLAATRQAPSLVVAYKRCMVAADSTSEARKFAAYERELYCAYLKAADARCRTANRCDWVEEYSDMECGYASPGTGDCGL